MVNMLKVVIAATILLTLLGIIFLGKRAKYLLKFSSVKTLRQESAWIINIIGVMVITIAIFDYIRNKPEATIIMWIGTGIYFLGGILQIISRKQLGSLEENFNKHKGLYNRIRHPSKTACLLMSTGICLAMNSWWALILLLVLFLPAMLFRISQEEQTMADKYGEEWLIYQSDTKKIIPGII